MAEDDKTQPAGPAAETKVELEQMLSAAENLSQASGAVSAPKSYPVWIGTVSESELGELSKQELTRLVFVAGMPKSGKTTLLAAIYDEFLRGPLEDIQFAGSRSLPRLEAVSFYARVESERSTAATKRTAFSKDEVDLVHFDSMRRGSGERFHLFLTDISGEAFERARDSVQDARPFSIARYADFLCFLIDALALSDPTTRHIAERDIGLICDSFIREGLLSPSTRAQIIVSRIDLVPQEGSDASRGFIENATKSLEELLRSRVASVNTFMIAARPANGRPIGLLELLKSWCYELDSEAPAIPQFRDDGAVDDFGLAPRVKDQPK